MRPRHKAAENSVEQETERAYYLGFNEAAA